VAYGTVDLPDGKMSSREGLVVNSDDVYEDVIAAEAIQISKSMKNVENKEETTEKISMAAFKYGMLKVDAKHDIVFDVEEVTRFEGNTGPYVLYTYARCMSVLDKASHDKEYTYDTLMYREFELSNSEKELVRTMQKFPEVVFEAGEKLTPHVIVNYSFELAQKFNAFYSDVKILNNDKKVNSDFRILLTSTTSLLIKRSMELLGIKTVERM
jgi:arginyl-tRNA synthetase